jgi:hypothetical protein
MAAVKKIIPDLKYHRRHPESGLLFRVVETYWPMFLREQERVGRNIPAFIKDEFSKYLRCGIPEYGFVRTYCHQCRESGIVAFSCKKRGFCPSCCARRMNDEAAHLVDQVLPEVVMRQWVLSFPYKLRYQMAHNPKLTNQILSIFIRAISTYQKKKAKLYGIKAARTGAVTFIQRFGSALNLNVHFHTLFADGVYYKTENGDYKFLRLSEPTQEELISLASKIQNKVSVLIQKLGLDDQDQVEFDETLLSDVATISIQNKAGFGERAGQSLRRYGIKKIEVDPEGNDPYSANVGGYSLNARVWVGGRDREKLEKLIRYMARGPIATERLSESFPNLLIYKMKTQWRDGTTHVSFSYLDFIARLVALIPPARMNLVRYYGVFAPNFKGRSKIVQKKSKNTGNQAVTAPDIKETARRARMLWSDMLKRTFKIDVTVCPHCGGRLEQIAVIKDKVVALTILRSLQEATVFKPLTAIWERGPPDQPSGFENEFDQRDSW